MDNNNQVTVFSEINAIKNNKEIFKLLGERCLIICSKSSAIKSGALSDVTDVLNEYKIQYEIFSDIKQNPTVTSCIEAGRKANSIGATFLIGIGGGSPLDATKTASIVATNPDITEDKLYEQSWEINPLPFILIGTTAGTGSEVTNVSVLTNKNGMKKSIHNDVLYAEFAFCDPRYTTTMPIYVQASTAIDALSHLIESYFSNKANEVSRKYSIDGIKILFPYIKMLNDGKNLTLEQRKEVYDAAILGGRAIDITGTTFCHAVGYYFTENFKIPHGFACALFLNGLIDYETLINRHYSGEFFDQIKIDKEELKKEITKMVAHIKLHIFDSDIEKIKNRYTDNKSVKNTYQELTMDWLIKLIKESFK